MLRRTTPIDYSMTSSPESYPPPVNQLLNLGQPKGHDFTLDYATFGIGSDSIPDLLRMVADESLHHASGESKEVWAPVHAWRALAGLKAEVAIEPLLGLLPRIDKHDDDWVSTEMPRVFGEIGGAAVEPVTAYLAEAAHDDWARIAAARALGEIGTRHPDLRAGCVARLSAQLEQFAAQTEALNAFLVSPLLDLEAREALPVMTRAFAAGRVDESVVGDYEDVEIAFGLKTQRRQPRKPNKLTELGAKLRAISEASQEVDGLLDGLTSPAIPSPQASRVKLGRNDPCPCGSGKKYKKCCGKPV